jgi:hypothetical protein
MTWDEQKYHLIIQHAMVKWDPSGWLLSHLPLLKMKEFVSWDHDIPNISQPDGKITHVPNHQPDMLPI